MDGFPNFLGVYLNWENIQQIAKEFNVPTVTPAPLKSMLDYRSTRELISLVKEMPDIEGFIDSSSSNYPSFLDMLLFLMVVRCIK